MTDVTEIEEAPATSPEEETAKGYEFDDKFQKKIVGFVLRDQNFVERTDGLIQPKFFENPSDAFLIDVLQGYFRKYRSVPHPSTLITYLNDAYKAKKVSEADKTAIKKRFKDAWAAGVSDKDYVIDQVAGFAQTRAMEEAIMKSADMLMKGARDFGKIEKMIREAVQVGVAMGRGSYDYFKEIDSRTEYRDGILKGTIVRDSITTGYEEIDKHLYHKGWGRRELSAIMGRAKIGKSMSLGTFAKNAVLAGHDVILFTAEMGANIYADRLDAAFSETAMMLLESKPNTIRKAIKEAEAKTRAKLIIEDFGTGTLKPSMIRNVLNYHKARGRKFDLCVMDYADIFCAENPTGKTIEDSRSIWVDCRAICQEENMAGLTGTQTNRDGAKATVAGATDVAEDYNKIRIADLTMSLNATDAEIKANKLRLHFAASRNQKEVTLDIDQSRETMNFIKKVVGVRL
jgi:replicative DNA helicase